MAKKNFSVVNAISIVFLGIIIISHYKCFGSFSGGSIESVGFASDDQNIIESKYVADTTNLRAKITSDSSHIIHYEGKMTIVYYYINPDSVPYFTEGASFNQAREFALSLNPVASWIVFPNGNKDLVDPLDYKNYK